MPSLNQDFTDSLNLVPKYPSKLVRGIPILYSRSIKMLDHLIKAVVVERSQTQI